MYYQSLVLRLVTQKRWESDRKVIYFLKRYGVTEEQAKEMMPKQQEETTEDEE